LPEKTRLGVDCRKLTGLNPRAMSLPPAVPEGRCFAADLLKGNCLGQRRRFIDAAPVRKNWFSLALILEDMLPDGGEASRDKFRRCLTILPRRAPAGQAQAG
jgi:hypothetical protein